MRKILNKKGIGIPTLLLIVTFLLGTGASLLTLSYQQSFVVEKNIENTEAYTEAVYNVDATIRLMIRELNLDNDYLEDPNNIDYMQDYFNVTIERYPSTAFIYTVSSRLSDTRTVRSFLSANSGTGTSGLDTTDLIEYFGMESTNLNEVPETFIADYLPFYFESYDITTISDPRRQDLDSVKSIAQYISRRTSFIEISPTLLNQNNIIDGDFYVNNNLTINAGNTLHIAEGHVLFITGNLTMEPNSNLYGNIIVGNNATFSATTTSSSVFEGTMYVGNHFTSNTNMTFGTAARPTFVFSQISNTLKKNGTGYAYFVAPSFKLDGVSTSTLVSISGGVYSDNVDIKRGTLTVAPFDLSTIYDKFSLYALPTYSSMLVSGDYTYTNPRIG
jgi:hypothetical protein